MTMRILVVEDESAIADAVRRTLEREGHDVAIADSVEKGSELFRSWPPDLLLLDLGLPDADGTDLAREIRRFSDTPIIIVTARGAEADRVAGLDLGADDYLVKPFGADELMARIRAVTRRARRGLTRRQRYAHAGLELDDELQQVSLHGTPLKLRRREYEMLRMLLERPGEIVTREVLARSLWGLPAHKARKSIDVHVTWLRRKLEVEERAPTIETVRAVGFRLVSG